MNFVTKCGSLIRISCYLLALLMITHPQKPFARKTGVIQLRASNQSIQPINTFMKSIIAWPKPIQEMMQRHKQQNGLRVDVIRNIVSLCATEKHNTPAILETSKFTINQPDFCKQRPHVRYLFVVHSHAKARHRRDLIRSTWASLRRVGDERIATLFFLGRAVDNENQLEIDAESERYRDIIQRDFVEDYHNMTRKHLTVMEWISMGYCESVDYLIKVDDDTFVDVFHLVRFIKTEHTKLPNSFYCSATSGAKPVRPDKKTSSKWAITKAEFPNDVFPTYCEGLGYIIEASLAPYLYWCSLFTPPIWIDDVYVTGMLAENLGFARHEFIPGHAYSRVGPSKQNEALLDNIFLTSYHSEFLPETFRRLWHTAVSRSMNAA